MSDINLIITCDRTDCPYNHEKECGKDIFYADDKDCLKQMKGATE